MEWQVLWTRAVDAVHLQQGLETFIKVWQTPLSPISNLPAEWVHSNVHWTLYGLSSRHKVQVAASHKWQQIPRDLWNIFINNLDDCTEGILSKCVGENKQGSVPWSAGLPLRETWGTSKSVVTRKQNQVQFFHKTMELFGLKGTLKIQFCCWL